MGLPTMPERNVEQYGKPRLGLLAMEKFRLCVDLFWDGENLVPGQRLVARRGNQKWLDIFQKTIFFVS